MEKNSLDNELEFFLKHHGVKGQQWGVRRANRKLAKADKKWEKNLNSTKTFIEVHNRAAQLSNDLDIDRINNMPKFKNRNMHDSNDPVTKAYFKAHEEAFNSRMSQAANEIVGTNPSGTKKIHINPKTGEVKLVDLSHADESLHIVAEFDELNHIIGFKVVDDSMKQSSLVEEFLEHHGVKGQRWGVRRQRTQAGRQAVDSKRASELRNKPLSSLSNKQLKTLNERKNLESNFKKLNPSKLQTGKKIALEILATAGIGVTAYNMLTSPAAKALINLGKKSASTQLKLF